MMSFAEKLSFLMRISQTSNKELAAALGVNPSMVSLMRSGKRKLPQNPAQGKKIAAFLARRCSAPFQRRALSEMLGQMSISPSMPVEALEAALESWLRGESNTLTDTFLTSMDAPSAADADFPMLPEVPASRSTDSSQTRFFFGDEGRREVMTCVMAECQKLPSPGTILTVIDDNLEWLLSDYVLTRKTQNGLLYLLNHGFTIQQVVPPMNYINRYAESLQFWLPLYATGKATAYYYPRLRGNLYRHSIVVIPGCCVQYSAAVALASTSEITMFSTDPALVNAFEKQFQEHVSLCRPALMVHRDHAASLDCFREFNRCRGSNIQLMNNLSLASMPRELLEQYILETDSAISRDTYQVYLDTLPFFEEKLAEEPFIDMCRLAPPEEVLAGNVPVATSAKRHLSHPFYTPEAYCLHLTNILRLMEQYENYYFLPVVEKEYPDYDLFANEEGMALIVRTDEPFMTMEIRRQSMVEAFREHILRRADVEEYGHARREMIKMELRTLIQKLTVSPRTGK